MRSAMGMYLPMDRFSIFAGLRNTTCISHAQITLILVAEFVRSLLVIFRLVSEQHRMTGTKQSMTEGFKLVGARATAITSSQGQHAMRFGTTTKALALLLCCTAWIGWMQAVSILQVTSSWSAKKQCPSGSLPKNCSLVVIEEAVDSQQMECNAVMTTLCNIVLTHRAAFLVEGADHRMHKVVKAVAYSG